MEAGSDDGQTTHSAVVPTADTLSGGAQPSSNLGSAASHGGSSTSLPEKASLLSATSARSFHTQTPSVSPAYSTKAFNPGHTIGNPQVFGNQYAVVTTNCVDQSD